MKKSRLMVTLLLVITMTLTSCGSTNPFYGKWQGTCNLTEYIESVILQANPNLKDSIDFKDLVLEFEFSFTEDEMTMSITQESIATIGARLEEAYKVLIDAQLKQYMEEFGGLLTKEELAIEYGYTAYEDLLNGMVANMQVDTLLEGFKNQLQLSGTYAYDEESQTLTVFYENGSSEQMQYAFEGDNLTITISDGADSFAIKCKKK